MPRNHVVAPRGPSLERVGRLYQAVFARPARVKRLALPDPEIDAYEVNGWLALLWTGRSLADERLRERWAVRVLREPEEGSCPLLREWAGQYVERPTFEDAFVYLAGLEAHRLSHVAMDQDHL